MGTFKEHSRTAFTEDKITHEGVRTGSLQRIADACELIAKDRAETENQLKYYKNLAAQRSQEIDLLYKENKGLKSWVTRYRNQIKRNLNK